MEAIIVDGWLVYHPGTDACVPTWMDAVTHRWHSSIEIVCNIYSSREVALRVASNSSSTLAMPVMLTADGNYAVPDGARALKPGGVHGQVLHVP